MRVPFLRLGLVREAHHARVLGHARPLRWLGLAGARLRPARDRDLARAHDLLDAHRPQQLDEGLQLALVARRLQHERYLCDVDDLGPENVRGTQDLLAMLRLGVHANQHQLALDVALVGQVVDLDDVDELVQLLRHLLDHELVAADHQGHARHRGIERLADRQTLDVVAARREQPRHAREDAELVLDEHGDRVLAELGAVGGHGSCWGPRHGPQTPNARTRPGTAVARLGIARRCLISEPRLRLLGAIADLARGRGQDHVGIGTAGGDHREDALLLVDAHVQNHRRRRAEHLLEGGHDLARLGHAQPNAAVGLGQLHPVGDAGQVDRAVALPVDDALPLAHHAVAAVVDDDRLHGQLLDETGSHFLAVHLERAVAVDVDDLLVRVRGLDAHGRRQAVAHGAEAARREPRAGMLEFVVLRRPHLVLADAGHDHRLAAREIRDLLDDVLRLDDIVVPVVTPRLRFLPFRDLRVPRAAPLAAVAGRLHLLAHGLDERAQHAATVADDRHVDLAVLGTRRGVDVDVDD